MSLRLGMCFPMLGMRPDFSANGESSMEAVYVMDHAQLLHGSLFLDNGVASVWLLAPCICIFWFRRVCCLVD